MREWLYARTVLEIYAQQDSQHIQNTATKNIYKLTNIYKKKATTKKQQQQQKATTTKSDNNKKQQQQKATKYPRGRAFLQRPTFTEQFHTIPPVL